MHRFLVAVFLFLLLPGSDGFGRQGNVFTIAHSNQGGGNLGLHLLELNLAEDSHRIVGPRIDVEEVDNLQTCIDQRRGVMWANSGGFNGDNTLLEVDLQTGEVLSAYDDLLPDLDNLMYDHRTDQLIGISRRYLYVVDLQTLQVKTMWREDRATNVSWNLSVTSQPGYVFMTSHPYVMVLDIATGNTIKRYELDDWFESIHYDPLSKRHVGFWGPTTQEGNIVTTRLGFLDVFSEDVQVFTTSFEYNEGTWRHNESQHRSGMDVFERKFYAITSNKLLTIDLKTLEVEFDAVEQGVNYVYWKVYNDLEHYDTSEGIEIAGTVIADLDSDCLLGENEQTLANQLLILDPVGFITRSSQAGEFKYKVAPGDYEIRLLDPANLWGAGCDNKALQVEITGAEVDAVNILVPSEPQQFLQRLDLSLVNSRPRLGLEMTFDLSYTNRGTVPFSGTVRFTYDSELLTDFESTFAADRLSAGIAEWDLNNVPIGGSRSWRVTLTLGRDEALRGRELCANFEVLDKQRDDVLHKYAEDFVCAIVQGSYDPNDIAVEPAGFGSLGFIRTEDSTLSYTIRFQNLGDAPVRDVVILDTLDADMDVKSLHFGAAMHDYTVSLLKDRVLEFRFDGIELPGKEEDEPGSHGAVKYKIDLAKNLPLGTEIHNRAAIYFDFNKPVITNTVVNTITEPTTDVHDMRFPDQLELRSLGQGHFVWHCAGSLDGRLSVYSLLGVKMLEQELVNSGHTEIDLSNQPAGVYLMRVESGAAVKITSVVVP